MFYLIHMYTKVSVYLVDLTKKYVVYLQYKWVDKISEQFDRDKIYYLHNGHKVE